MSLRRSTKMGGAGKRSMANSKVTSDISKKSFKHEPLEDYEAEMEKLRNQLTIEMRRNTMLDSELRLALTAAHKAEEAHQNELKTSESDVKRLLSERRALLAKFSDIEVLEGSVRELYVQMKDRLTEDAPQPSSEQLKAEKAALEKEPILAVVGALRARLEGLWTFKVEAEVDLRASRTAQQQRAHAQALDLKADLHTLETELRQTRKELDASKAEALAAKQALAAVAHEAQAVTADMAAQHAELLAALRASVKEGGVAQRQAAAAYAEGKARDALVLANRQLESARHFDRVTQDKELRRLQHDHEVELGEMVHMLGGLSYQTLINSQLKEELHQAKHTIVRLKREAQQPSELKALQHKVRLLEQELAHTLNSLSRAPKQPAGQHSKSDGLRWSLQSQPSEGALTIPPPFTPSPSSPLSRTKQQQHRKGRANESMTRSAHAIMTSARTAAEQARLKAAEQVEDPLYHVIANVGSMHQAAKSALREVRHEVIGLGCSLEPAAEQANQPQATSGLEAALQPSPNHLGAPGTNNKKPVRHKAVVV